MLTVCLHKLCAKDSLANAVRKVDKCANIVPRGVENHPREGPTLPFGGLRRALGRQVGPIWLPRPLESGIWAALGCAWDAPGGSWAALGTSRGAPGASWGAPGASWDAPGAHFGLPGVTYLEPFGPLFGEPMQNGENLEIRRQYGTFWGFSKSRGLQNRSKIDSGSLLGSSGRPSWGTWSSSGGTWGLRWTRYGPSSAA